MNNIINLLLVILAVMVGLVAINYALNKNEAYECEKLTKQSQELEAFYWTDWQAEMCEGVMYRNYEQANN